MSKNRKTGILAALAATIALAAPALAGIYQTVANGSVRNHPVTGGATVDSSIQCRGARTGEQAVMVTQITMHGTDTTFGVVASDDPLAQPDLFNSGSVLTAGAKYTFTWIAKPGVTYDWYWGTTSRIRSMDTVEEGR